MSQIEPGSVNVIAEEHPELDNPLGRAQGRVEAAETYLAEQHDIVERLSGKVERAAADLAMAESQKAEAESQIPDLEADLEAARQALASVESE